MKQKGSGVSGKLLQMKFMQRGKPEASAPIIKPKI